MYVNDLPKSCYQTAKSRTCNLSIARTTLKPSIWSGVYSTGCPDKKRHLLFSSYYTVLTNKKTFT